MIEYRQVLMRNRTFQFTTHDISIEQIFGFFVITISFKRTITTTLRSISTITTTPSTRRYIYHRLMTFFNVCKFNLNVMFIVIICLVSGLKNRKLLF